MGKNIVTLKKARKFYKNLGITKKQKDTLFKLIKNIIEYDTKQSDISINELLNDLPYHMELANTLSELYYYELLEENGYILNSLELVKEFTEKLKTA